MTEQSQVLDLTALRLPPETVSHAQSLVGVAERAVITDRKAYGDSGSVVAQINAHLDKIDADKDTVVRPLNQAKDAFMKLWHQARDPLDAAKKLLVLKQNAFLEREEADRLAEEKRLREEQEAAALKQAQEAEAEANRLAAEAAEREAAGNATEAQELREQSAEKAQEAQEVVEEAIHAPVIVPPAPRVSRGAYGSAGQRTVWYGEIQDWNETFKQIGTNQKVRDAMQSAVDALVRSGTRQLPGVRIYSKQEASNRR